MCNVINIEVDRQTDTQADLITFSVKVPTNQYVDNVVDVQQKYPAIQIGEIQMNKTVCILLNIIHNMHSIKSQSRCY